MTTVIALLGAKALYLLYLWLIGAVICTYLADRKGFTERAGLASALILPFVSIIAWLLWPAKADSRWKLQGAFGSGGKTAAEARAALEERRGEDSD
ncbi:MAG TPA: hypothetical protein VK304_05380 [Thermoleophilaceae bacterium]|nr:hypothetical protein [Thermoleophilaceae bacterium]